MKEFEKIYVLDLVSAPEIHRGAWRKKQEFMNKAALKELSKYVVLDVTNWDHFHDGIEHYSLYEYLIKDSTTGKCLKAVVVQELRIKEDYRGAQYHVYISERERECGFELARTNPITLDKELKNIIDVVRLSIVEDYHLVS